MDTILDNTLGENYFDTRALADFVSCASTGVNSSVVVLSCSTHNYYMLMKVMMNGDYLNDD